MRKSSFALAMIIAVLMTMAFPSFAAELKSAHQDTDLKCAGDEDGVWHFVNPQTEGATSGYIVVQWDDGTTVTVAASKINRSMMHFWVVGPEDHVATAHTYTDIAGTTPVPGKLVISDSYCEKK